MFLSEQSRRQAVLVQSYSPGGASVHRRSFDLHESAPPKQHLDRFIRFSRAGQS